jgi:ribosome-binding ATPase YchF (GTP1/OBG family)
VVRCFDNNEEVIHVENSIDPVRDYQIVQSELILADLQQIEKRMKKMKVKSEADKEEKKLLEKIRKGLAEEVPLNQMNLSLEERRVIKGFNLLSEKPAIVIANYSGFAEELQKISSFCQEQKIPFFPFALKMESEIEELTAEEKEILGCRSSDLAIFAEKVKEALDLKSFLTVGKDEIKN